MKKATALIAIMAAFMLAGCSDGHVPAPQLESEGVEDILVENIIVEEIQIDPIRVEDVEKVIVDLDGPVDSKIASSGIFEYVKTVKLYLKNGGFLEEPKESFCDRFKIEDVLWRLNDKTLWCVLSKDEEEWELQKFMGGQ